jgi:hypothetical protein
LRRRCALRLDFQILYRKPQLVAALGTVTAVALYRLARRLQLDPSVEEFAAV